MNIQALKAQVELSYMKDSMVIQIKRIIWINNSKVAARSSTKARLAAAWIYVGRVFPSPLSILLPPYVENHLIVNITAAESISVVGLLYVKAEVRQDLMAGGGDLLLLESYGTCSRVSKKMWDCCEMQVAVELVL